MRLCLVADQTEALFVSFEGKTLPTRLAGGALLAIHKISGSAADFHHAAIG